MEKVYILLRIPVILLTLKLEILEKELLNKPLSKWNMLFLKIIKSIIFRKFNRKLIQKKEVKKAKNLN